MKRQTLNRIRAVAIAAAATIIIPAIRAQDVPPAPSAPPAPVAVSESPAPRVQLAILLDTSGSMSGLIEQAKTQLWKVVNTFIAAKQNGRTPEVEVALYEYGKDSLSQESHWVRRILPLTRDLDKVSEELFALGTNGGSEFCGAVIERAAADLAWDPSPDTYKAIFIAGNEPFTQGPVKPETACKAAATRGVVVNTIHCGGESEGIDGGWKKGAELADGKFLIIDSNKAVVHIEAPQDNEIVKLNEEINKTYLAYGGAGARGVANQVAQDANAAKFEKSGAALNRAVTKASSQYKNATWDLVDAAKEKDFDLAKVADKDLPEELRPLAPAARVVVVESKSKERAAIQEKILSLNKEREAFLAGKRKELAEKGGDTLDAAMVETVRSQAARKGVKFE